MSCPYVIEIYKSTPLAQFHGFTYLVGWYVCQLISLYALLFRSRTRVAIYVHIVAMSLMVILTLLGATELLTYIGTYIITFNWYHSMPGFILSVLSVFVAGLGILAFYKQGSVQLDPTTLDNIKLFHKLLGWAVIAIGRLPLYDWYCIRYPTLFSILFFFDIVLHGLYFYLKHNKVRMEQVSVDYGQFDPTVWIKRVNKQSDLQVYHGDFFIFADYIYRLGPVLGAHPGGFEIINQSRGREVDRFIYGMQPMEVYENLARCSHTAKSIQIAGLPVARLQQSSLFPKIRQHTKCKISAINFYQSSKRIYTVYLRPTEEYDINVETFNYNGYSDLSEIGKYFAVTIQNTKTRLYTLVNFLHPRTIKLVQRVTKGQVFNEQQKKMLGRKQNLNRQYHRQSIYVWSQALRQESVQESEKKQKKQSKFQSRMKSQEKSMGQESLMKFQSYAQNQFSIITTTRFQNNSIPLLIKKYNDGQFTPAFLNGGFDINAMLSKPRGRGLALQDLLEYPKPYNVLMFSGGTGIYPYADTIDLLFKELIVQTDKSMAGSIISNDPILQNNPFKDFNFTLYISVPTVEEIHPITLFQCEFLALHGRIKVYLRSSIEAEKNYIFKRYPNIQPNPFRYEKVLKQLNPQEISRIFICGPTRMTKTMLVELKRLEWSPRKYFVI